MTQEQMNEIKLLLSDKEFTSDFELKEIQSWIKTEKLARKLGRTES